MATTFPLAIKTDDGKIIAMKKVVAIKTNDDKDIAVDRETGQVKAAKGMAVDVMPGKSC